MVHKYAFICHTHGVSRDLAGKFLFVGEWHVCQLSNVQKFIVARHPCECGPEERTRIINISSINTTYIQLLNIMHKRNS